MILFYIFTISEFYNVNDNRHNKTRVKQLDSITHFLFLFLFSFTIINKIQNRFVINMVTNCTVYDVCYLMFFNSLNITSKSAILVYCN